MKISSAITLMLASTIGVADADRVLKKSKKGYKSSKSHKGYKSSKSSKASYGDGDGDVDMYPDIDEEDCRALFGLWNAALQTKNPSIVADRYASDGVLLPTLKDDVRADYDGIRDYFVSFTAGGPYGTIIEDESYVQVGEGWCQDMGIYEFEFDDGSVVPARYSFVYVYEDGEWMIAHHHSSQMPEDVINPVEVDEDEIRAQFGIWNAALQTGNSRTVAQLYSKHGVLLPTLKDNVRSDFAGIKDYFDLFLAKGPVGEILDSSVIVGDNWAQDAGIYEFTFDDGSKARARYTFVYIYEDGAWRISQHHSSQMPSDLAGVTLSKQECADLFNLWNDALLTLSPATVRDRYGKDALLLPTLKDNPRDTPALIEDYFVSFLAKEPRGTILESWVTTGKNWCSDQGLYRFDFADGSSAEGRYTYVYMLEDGEWMINHHHSSLMPSAFP